MHLFILAGHHDYPLSFFQCTVPQRYVRIENGSRFSIYFHVEMRVQPSEFNLDQTTKHIESPFSCTEMLSNWWNRWIRRWTFLLRGVAMKVLRWWHVSNCSAAEKKVLSNIYIGVVLAIGRVRKGLEPSLESLLSSITTLLVHFSHPPVCCGMETCRLHSGTAIALCHCHLCSHKDLADSQSPSSAGISVPMGHRTSRHFPAVA